jgi:histidinol-phosphate/aromatic aminotransferase/cobyric acid decarboxylase-like protein
VDSRINMTNVLAFHGGNLRRLAEQAQRSPDDVLDFSASINPLGPPEWLPGLIHSRLSAIAHYPDPDCTDLCAAAARHFEVDAAEIIAGNGSAELLHILPRAIGAGRAVIPVPSYGDYRVAAEAAGLTLHRVPLRADAHFALDFGSLESALQGHEIVMLGQPNNPTGQHTSEAAHLPSNQPDARDQRGGDRALSRIALAMVKARPRPGHWPRCRAPCSYTEHGLDSAVGDL